MIDPDSLAAALGPRIVGEGVYAKRQVALFETMIRNYPAQEND